MSQWELLQIETSVLSILDVRPRNPEHHFGRPFLTPYQIAIELERRFPQEFAALGKPLGGTGTAQQDSVAQYIARELSRRIADGRLTRVEGRFLSLCNLASLKYARNGEIVESSPGKDADLSMFRLAD